MPLRPVEFHILLALASEERHGYAILQEVAALTEGGLELEPGTLYRALHRMLKDGWVAESTRRPAADLDDERRRYYRLTALGRRIATAEADRLWRLVSLARTHRLLSHGWTCPAERVAKAERRRREFRNGDLPRRVAWWLVWAYPPRFRRDVGQGLVDALDDRMRARRAAGASSAAVWARAIADTLRNAGAEWIDELEGSGPSSASGPP